jgi:hypothetical protein
MKLYFPLTRIASALLCLGIVLAAGNAVGQQKTLKELIVGTWLLESVYDQTQDGIKHDPWGPGVKGIAMFDANGWFSWQMLSADRSKTASNNPRNPVGPAIAYFGTYTVDEAAKTLTDHLERCTFPQWDGIEGTLNVEFPTENELKFTTTKPIQDPSLGPFIPHLNFKRAR